jgi:outer membrane protein assembly factor BamD
MNKNFIIFLVGLIFLFVSCSKNNIPKSTINEKSLELQIIEAYKKGVIALEDGDVLYAAKKFNEVEILFPQSDLAPQSALMAAYSYYRQDYYSDAIAELKRFTKVYPLYKDLDYAYYLLAICYFEQIVDEKKDLQAIINAKKTFEIVVNNYSDTEYAIDSDFKLDLIDDILASKEMYIGRYYFEKNKWIPAINRFKEVIDRYDTTIYAEEALYRLVEVYYIIGLTEEAQKYANLLGYNYQSSEWYEKSYVIFEKSYKKNKLKNDKKKFIILDKFKSLLD